MFLLLEEFTEHSRWNVHDNCTCVVNELEMCPIPNDYFKASE